MSHNNNEGGCRACNRNPHEHEFDKVVATWQTVRHYKVCTHDTLHQICDDMDHKSMEHCHEEKCRERGEHGSGGGSRGCTCRP